MVTDIDEGQGLVKTSWEQVRERVAKVAPAFANIVDQISPNRKFPIYLAYRPWGDLEGDTKSLLLPNFKGDSYYLSDPDAPKEIQKDLGYGKDHSPFGMVLEKNLELFIDLKGKGITIPYLFYPPGSFFPYARVLNRQQPRIYQPNGILSAVCGARSVFMLPNIGITTKHTNLQSDFNVKSPPAKRLYDHAQIFKEIVQSPAVDCSWRSCVMYFSKPWVQKLYEDPVWQPLKLFLYEQAWNMFEYERNRIFYELAFSIIQKQRNLQPNPYLADTARHLFAIALGVVPGYSPALNDDAVPVKILQEVFVESYGLKQLPTIMQPTHLHFEEERQPVYYSLQYPSTLVFSPQARRVPSVLNEMRELAHIMERVTDEFSKENQICSDTVIRTIAQEVGFNYYHNESDSHNVITHSETLAKQAPRFTNIHPDYKHPEAEFASDATFLRGCVRIGKPLSKKVQL